MQRLRLALPLLALIAFELASCGGGDPRKEGLAAVQSNEWEKAVPLLEEALAKATPGTPEQRELAVARCTALAHTDAKRAVSDFETFAQGAKVEVSDFTAVVSQLLSAKEFVAAVELMDKGMKRFPEDPKMVALKDKVLEASLKANDPASQSAIKGLGYAGD